MWTSLIIGIVGSAIVAVVYGLCLAGRERAIRGYLLTKRRGWIRARYVKAFVQAVRGYAPTTDTTIIANLVVLILFGFSIGSETAATRLGQGMAENEARYSRLEARLQAPEKVTLESLVDDLRDVRRQIDELKPSVRRYVVVTRLAGFASLAVFYYLLLLWVPFVRLRRRFASEIDRFTLRIQGLASKSELAELALAESRVVDESTLRAFIDAALSIAARHEVREIADRFYLWQNGVTI